MDAQHYAERRCLVCGATFIPQYAAHVCCGDDCRKARFRQMQAAWARTDRARRREWLASMKAELAALREHVAALSAERDTLRAEVERLKAGVNAEAAPEQEKAPTTHRYPERKCCHCGKPFWPERPNSAYCSDICRNAAERERRYRGMHVCDRLHLRQLSALPCGDRPECWKEPPCDRIPAAKERVTGIGPGGRSPRETGRCENPLPHPR